MKITLPWTATNSHTNGIADRLDEVRDALGREVDHLAQVAAQMGRDATDQAEVVAHDAGKQTGAVLNRLVATAAALGPTLAVIGRQRMKGLSQQAQTLSHDLGQQAQTLGHELRQVRITTEPPRRSQGSGVALVGGIGIGVAAGIATMYLFDPEHGKRRRTLLMGRLARWTRAGREVAAQKASAFADRTVGVMSDLRDSVTTGIGVEGTRPVIDEYTPAVAEATPEDVWSEGTRVPIT